MSTDAIRKSRARQKRKDNGLTEVRVWLERSQSEAVSLWAESGEVSRQEAVKMAIDHKMKHHGL